MRAKHELVRVEGKKSKLTITPDRMSVKVARRDWDRAGELYQFGLDVADKVDCAYSLRGNFDVPQMRISMYYGSNRQHRVLYSTYDFA